MSRLGQRSCAKARDPVQKKVIDDDGDDNTLAGFSN